MGPKALDGLCARCADASLPNILAKTLDVFTTSIFLCLIMAIVTLAVTQLMQPFLRALLQNSLLHSWRSELIEDRFEGLGRSAPVWLQKAFHFITIEDVRGHIENGRRFPKPELMRVMQPTSNGLFMKTLADAAALVVAHPSQSASEYLKLTIGVSDDDRDALLWLDVANREDPTRVASLVSGPPAPRPPEMLKLDRAERSGNSGFAEAIAAAQDAVSTGVERRLDVMQIRLDGAVAFYRRILAILIGVIIAYYAFRTVTTGYESVSIVLGATGGLLASLIYDVIGSYGLRRK